MAKLIKLYKCNKNKTKTIIYDSIRLIADSILILSKYLIAFSAFKIDNILKLSILKLVIYYSSSIVIGKKDDFDKG